MKITPSQIMSCLPRRSRVVRVLFLSSALASCVAPASPTWLSVNVISKCIAKKYKSNH